MRQALQRYGLAIAVAVAPSIALAQEPSATGSPTYRGWDLITFAVGAEASPQFAGVVADFDYLSVAAGRAWSGIGRDGPYVTVKLRFPILGFLDAGQSHWLDPYVAAGYTWETTNWGLAELGTDVALSPRGFHPFVRFVYRIRFGPEIENLAMAAIGVRLRTPIHGRLVGGVPLRRR